MAKYRVLVTFEVEAENQSEADGVVQCQLDELANSPGFAWIGIDPADIMDKPEE